MSNYYNTLDKIKRKWYLSKMNFFALQRIFFNTFQNNLWKSLAKIKLWKFEFNDFIIIYSSYWCCENIRFQIPTVRIDSHFSLAIRRSITCNFNLRNIYIWTYSTIQHSTIQYSTIQYSTVQMKYNSIR